MDYRVLAEVGVPGQSGGQILLQWCQHNNGEQFYRFHRRKADGKLIKYGQAMIPSMSVVHKLIAKAIEEGWKIS